MTDRRDDLDDLDDELADFVERSAARRVEAGVDPKTAARQARAELGSPAAIRDQVRDQRRGAWLATAGQDLRFGARLMRRSPAFTLVAACVLALGIGVPTALFSIVNGLFFAPLPVAAPEEVVYLYRRLPNGRSNPIMLGALDLFAAQGADLAEFTSHAITWSNVSIGGEAQVTRGELVDANYFNVLRVGAEIGRTFIAADTEASATDHAVVISHDLWQRRFGGDTTVLGQKISLPAIGAMLPHTIVGVAPAGFRGVTDPWSPSQFWAASRTAFGHAIARLKAGTSLSRFSAFVDATTPAVKLQAQQGFASAMGTIRLSSADISNLRFVVHSAKDVRIPGDPDARVVSRGLLLALSVVAALVLAIAIANVAGLLLARAFTRTSEIAVRRALGAGTGRLTRQLLAEAVLLALAAGALGLAVASGLLAVFRATSPANAAIDAPLDWRVLAFAIVACVGTGALIGLALASRAARVDVLSSLANGVAATRLTRARLRYAVVIPQIALTLVLLVVATVHVRALRRIEQADVGYATRGVTLLTTRRWTALPPKVFELPAEERRAIVKADVERARATGQRLLERVREVPGVRSAAVVLTLPFHGYMSAPRKLIAVGGDSAVPFAVAFVSAGYFETMGIGITSGREFSERDDEAQRDVVVLSESLARALWPGGAAVGRLVVSEQQPTSTTPVVHLQVVGVARDVQPLLDPAMDRAVLYVPVSLFASSRPIGGLMVNGAGQIVVRGEGDRTALIQRLRHAATGVDPAVEVINVQMIEQIVGDMLYPQRAAVAILAASGAAGLVLATIGLYGLVSYSVAQRQREIGIRAALGASPRDLIGLVLRDGAAVILLGGGAGVMFALIAVRASARLIAGLPVFDLVSLAVVPFVLAALIGAACYLPARRAASVNPTDVLRGA